MIVQVKERKPLDGFVIRRTGQGFTVENTSLGLGKIVLFKGFY